MNSRLGYAIAFVVLILLCVRCGKSSDDGSGASAAVYLPSDWDGSGDYPNSRWEFVSP